jgi:rhodanese-related sulfurtransferase
MAHKTGVEGDGCFHITIIQAKMKVNCMQKKKIVAACSMMMLGLFSTSAMASKGTPKAPVAKLCAFCHQDVPSGQALGFLENIALKSKTVQMNYMGHKGVIKFDDNTKVKNVTSLADIRNYKGKGFQVNFAEKNGEKIATEIIRFDILKRVTDDEKLDKAGFKKAMQQKGAVIYDVRPPMKYKMGHIAGAKPLPAPAFKKFIKKLPADKNTPILLYGVGGCLSPTTSLNLKALGYTDVKIYFGGFPDWCKSDYGVTTPDWLGMAIGKGIPHVLIDLRDAQAVKAGHIKGAVGIELASLAGKKSMFPAHKKAPIILYGAGKEEAAKTIMSWGYKKVRLLPMNYTKWQTAGKPVSTGNTATKIVYVPKAKPGTISVGDFEKMAAHTPANMVIVDVRNPDEAAKGTIKHAINIPADQIGQRMSEIPEGKEPVLFCPSGIRAEMAHNILKGAGMASLYLDAIIEVEKDGSFDVEEK